MLALLGTSVPGRQKAHKTNMEVQAKTKLPQEGTTDCVSGESLTESNSVCPSYSGGGNLCFRPGSSLDLSGLAEAIPPATKIDTDSVSEWTLVAHKRPCKKGKKPEVEKGLKGQPERSRRNRRARKEAPKPKKTTTTADAAAETQREAVQHTSTKAVTAPETTELPPPKPPPSSQPKKRRTPRGSRGRRNAAAAPTAPTNEQPGTGSGPAPNLPGFSVR